MYVKHICKGPVKRRASYKTNSGAHYWRTKLQYEWIQTGKARLLGQTSILIQMFIWHKSLTKEFQSQRTNCQNEALQNYFFLTTILIDRR